MHIPGLGIFVGSGPRFTRIIKSSDSQNLVLNFVLLRQQMRDRIIWTMDSSEIYYASSGYKRFVLSGLSRSKPTPSQVGVIG